MSLRERLLKSIGTKGTVKSSKCLSQIESSVEVRTSRGDMTVLTHDDLISNQKVQDGKRVVVINPPLLKPRVIELEE